MGTIAQEIERLQSTKYAIRQAIEDKGVTVTDADSFASYAEKIGEIQAGGGGDGKAAPEFVSFYGYTGKTLDLSWLDISNVTSMENMFNGCSRLTSLDVSGFDTKKVSIFSAFFSNCSNIVSLDLSSFNTLNMSNSYAFFQNCNNLTTIKFNTFHMGSVTYNYNMFGGCSKLTTITGTITGIKVNLSLSYSPLTRESALVVINGLANTTAAITLTLSATTKALLTDEDKAMVTSKGWTLA